MLKIVAICAMLFTACYVRAECPVQETTVVFMNGVWTPQQEAMHHTEKLAAAVYSTGISPDCVHFALSHTQNDRFVTDLVEAFIQKSGGDNSVLVNLLNMYFRVVHADAPFLNLVTNLYLSEVDDLSDSQLAKHLQNFKTLTKSDAPAVRLRQRGIMVTHSQGGLCGNAVYNQLTSAEKENARLITVATPSNHVADGGPNTRLVRDGVANLFFTDALAEGMVPNTGLCKNETAENPNSWECHGFDTGYLHDIGAREQIVADLIADLPVTPPGPEYAIVQGQVFLSDSITSVPGATVMLGYLTYATIGGVRNFDIRDITTTDANGFYRFSSVEPLPPAVPPYAPYAIWADTSSWSGCSWVTPVAGQTITKNVYFGGLFCP